MLDRFDLALLRELQADARLSNAELASRIGLSPAPTWRRVKRLELQGYITGYRAEIDRRKVGLGVLAFVRVDAERNNAAATQALEDRIRSLPEVVACHYISGAGTFELHVVATDLDAYSRWAMETLFKLPNVKDMHTSFSLGEVKAGGVLAVWSQGPDRDFKSRFGKSGFQVEEVMVRAHRGKSGARHVIWLGTAGGPPRGGRDR
jgi:DNA-binding Lrp family transcriptional regulator